MQNNKFLITLAAATFFFSSVCVNATPLVIPLQLGYEDPTVEQGDPHRSPVVVPDLSIDERTLLIPEALYNCELRLVNESGVVVYSTVIPVGCE